MTFFNVFISLKYNNNTDSSISKIKNLFLSLLFSFVCVVLILIFVITPIDLFVTRYLHYESIIKLIHVNSVKIEKEKFYIVLIIVPLLEEILFRLPLVINKINLSILGAFSTYLILGGKVINFKTWNYEFFLPLIVGILVFSIIYFFAPNIFLSYLKQKNSLIIAISTIGFGLIHINNIHNLRWELTLLYPFFVLPQMIFGYYIANLRLKYGFFWGLLLHAIINSLPFIISNS